MSYKYILDTIDYVTNEKGILKIAKDNAETLITGMLNDTDSNNKIKIEWK